MKSDVFNVLGLLLEKSNRRDTFIAASNYSIRLEFTALILHKAGRFIVCLVDEAAVLGICRQLPGVPLL